MESITLNPINLNSEAARSEVNAFLMEAGLILDSDVDYTVAVRRGETLIGTCSKAGRVIKCLAVSPAHRGEGLSGQLVKELIDRLFEEGIYHYFVFTQPHNTCLFKDLNFKVLYTGPQAVLLEGGIESIEKKLGQVKSEARLDGRTDRIALVMNCNPFTLGHRHLIEQAAAKGKEVLLFVVEENRSVFTFADRFEMVRRGTAHLTNVTVLPGTEYMISSTTFPSYFLRKADERTQAYMELDAGIFCTWFSRIFGIAARYVGEEPYCDVTLSYNNTLKRVLGEADLELVEIPRLIQNGEAISASRVRQLIREGKEAAIRELVPDSTWRFIFETQAGREAAARIRTSDSPH